jgi:hypothetical protein
MPKYEVRTLWFTQDELRAGLDHYYRNGWRLIAPPVPSATITTSGPDKYDRPATTCGVSIWLATLERERQEGEPDA